MRQGFSTLCGFCCLVLSSSASAIELPDQALLVPGAGVMPNVIVTMDNSNLAHRGSSDGVSDS
ncbi:MAG: hypothetical protein ACK4TK_08310, partial [Thiobacillaceae bacterium]